MPIISASVSWPIFAMIGSGRLSLPKFARSRSIRASRFSLELARPFMNKFRELGLIDYSGHIEVHSSLLNVVLHDQPQIRR